MKKLLALFTMTLFLGLAQGAWALTVSLTPSVSIGSVVLDISFTGSPPIGGYEMNILFNSTSLTFDYATSDPTQWFGVNFLGQPFTDSANPGVIFITDLVNGLSLSGDFLVATLNFSGNGSDAFTYRNLVLSNPDGTAVVPEPGTAILFGLGLIGLAGARRKHGKV